MREIRFEIPGEARGKGRPRFVRATGVAFTDAKTASYENLVKMAARDATTEPLADALKVHIQIWKGVPASWSEKKRKLVMGRYAPSGFDLDNTIKAILDGMNGVVFADDKQICQLSAEKRYGHMPRAVVVVSEAEDLF